MKKILLLTSLFAGAFAVLGSIGALHGEKGVDTISAENDEVSTAYSAKYKDCIAKEDFTESLLPGTDNKVEKSDWDLKKVNSSIAKYSKSMNATIKNLNYIDAHNYIHQEFQRSRNSVQNSGLSDIQKHYHREIMRICYNSDKALNLGSAGRL